MNNSINIKENVDGTFTVRYDNKTAMNICYDEMLGIVSQIAMPSERRCLRWLKSREEIEEIKKHSKAMYSNNRKESIIELFGSILGILDLTKEDFLKKTRKRCYADKRAAVACIMIDKGYTSYEISSIMELAPSSVRHYGTSMRFNIEKEIKELKEKIEKYNI